MSDVLLHIAARLVKGVVSPYADDWPKRMPKAALSSLAEIDEYLRRVGIQIRDERDKLVAEVERLNGIVRAADEMAISIAGDCTDLQRFISELDLALINYRKARDENA